jgi:hypothetical protein
MRFRRLSDEELGYLKDDFVKFLVSNTITADDWVKLKTENTAKAHELIDLFSDIVLEKVYQKVDLLEQREAQNLLFFHFEDELMTVLGIQTNSAIDFTDISEKYDLENCKLTGFRQTKVLVKGQKADEVHRLIESGCFVGREKLFQTLNQIIE